MNAAIRTLATALTFAVAAMFAWRAEATGPILALTTGDWSVEVVTDDLSYPWDIDRAGNQIVLTEAAGQIVMIENGRLNRYPVETSDPIVHDGGSGLLGMALAEDFQTSGLAYLYHTYQVALRSD